MGNNESKNTDYVSVPDNDNNNTTSNHIIDSNLPVAQPTLDEIFYAQDAALAQRVSAEDEIAIAAWDEYHNANYRYSAWSRERPRVHHHPPAVVIRDDDPEDAALILCLLLWLFFFFAFLFFLSY